MSTPAPDIRVTRKDQIFPVLTAAQIARLEPHGEHRRVRKGEVLVEQGDRIRHFVVVLSGAIDIVRPGLHHEELVVRHRAGQFMGEMSTLRGAASVVSARVAQDGEILSIDTNHLRAIVQTDSELSELLMRAFILRRVALLDRPGYDVILIGSPHSAGTLRLQQFLSRNGFPYVYFDVESDQSVQELLDRFHVRVEDVPVVICHGKTVLRNPDNRAVADCLRMNPEYDAGKVRDLVIIGAGPAGLAAAVYGASEGLDVLVLETHAPGGQAGSSSKIENYLGFPTGVSGRALAGRAFTQAQKFGAEVSVATSAVRLKCDELPYGIEVGEGPALKARAIVIATGAEYRKLALADIERFMGNGVYWAATPLEAKLCRDEEVIVVGGGNSAGQAAVFLSSVSRHVHILVRSGGLADSMSRYLIRRIEESPNVTLHTRTEIAALLGDKELERVTWRSGSAEETRDVRHVFLMTGAVPNTAWLEGCLRLDEKGFVCTGEDLGREDLPAATWRLERRPYAYETNLPGIFAVGDVRHGSVKRVASAVGEGSACVQAVHRVLAE
ncbi:MAG: FAD-dependent oxidoreductase [Usitatibacter sp.]